MKRENIGKKLKSLRISNDFSSETISEIINLQVNEYLAIERGKRLISIEQLIKLSKLYKTTIDSILFKREFTS